MITRPLDKVLYRPLLQSAKTQQEQRRKALLLRRDPVRAKRITRERR